MTVSRKIKKNVSVIERETLRVPEEGKPESWFLYILECADGSYYTGIAKDLDHRFKMHTGGKASRYTRSRLPVRMLYSEPCESRTHALVRECEVKAYPRNRKEALVRRGRAQHTVTQALRD